MIIAENIAVSQAKAILGQQYERHKKENEVDGVVDLVFEKDMHYYIFMETYNDAIRTQWGSSRI